MTNRNDTKWIRIAQWICGAVMIAAMVVVAVGRDKVPDGVMIGAAVLLIAAMIAGMALESKRREALARQQKDAPVLTDMASIVSRRVAHRYTGGGRGGHFTSHDTWCMTFSTAAHGKVELAVDWDTWQHNPDGTRGELRWKGTQLIRFRKR